MTPFSPGFVAISWKNSQKDVHNVHTFTESASWGMRRGLKNSPTYGHHGHMVTESVSANNPMEWRSIQV